MSFNAQEYWEQNWKRIQEKRELAVKFHPSNHKYITHLTYNGKGCAWCGKPQKGHLE